MNPSEFRDLQPQTVHYHGMARASSLLTAGFALTVVSGCGLETVELGGPTLEGRDADLAAEPPAPPPTENPVSPPNTAPTAPEIPIMPLNGIGELGGTFDELPAPPPSLGCTKVDFLFVIDNSFSMFLAQDNLKSSFGPFMQVIQQSLAPINDFRIMVVDTDGAGDEEDDEADAPADACTDTLGAGRRTDGDGQDCGLPGAQRFIELGQPNLEATFSCMASVGTAGDSDEQTIDAMLKAVSDENGPGRCNEGFLRDDALLVVTLITNSDDRRTEGDPADWFAQLTSLKGGNEAAFVVLGFLSGDSLQGAQPSSCDLLGVLNFVNSTRLQEFVTSFGHNQLASVCADDYGTFFNQAVGSIDTACDQLVLR